MSSSPPRPPPRRYGTIKRSKDEPEPKWWNEYPLEGDPKRPAVWLTNVLSKSPRLIGWDDERMERRALEALPKREGDEEDEDITEIHIGPKREVVDEVAFGLLGIAAREITKHLLHWEESQDGVVEREEETQEEHAVALDQQTPLSAAAERSVQQQHPQEASEKTPGAAAFAQYSGEDAATMEDTELYKLALRSLRWQRDNYLVGRLYADERKAERRRQQALLSFQPQLVNLLPTVPPTFDPAALGNQHIVRLGQWFIPGPVVHHSLLPIIVGLPSGPLRLPILNATVNLIPLSQQNVDQIIKERLLWFLKDDNMRKLIKTSANGYIANTYRDDEAPMEL